MSLYKSIRKRTRPLRRYIQSLFIKDQRPTVLMEFDNMLFNLHKNNTLENEIIQTGEFEKSIRMLFSNMIKEGNTVLDIGANIGVHSVFFSKLVGATGKVYSFEPVEYNLKRLNMNIRLNGVNNVTIVNKGVGDTNTIKTMNVYKESSPNLAVNSFLDYDYIQESIQDGLVEKKEFEIITIDSFIEEHGIESVDFVKMDIEGFEYYALLGAKKLIREKTPPIILEYYSERIRQNGLSDNDFKEILFDYYDCYEIVRDAIHEKVTSLVAFNFDREIKEADIVCLPKFIQAP